MLEPEDYMKSYPIIPTSRLISSTNNGVKKVSWFSSHSALNATKLKIKKKYGFKAENRKKVK